MAASSIDQYTDYLKQVLTPRRLQHSQGVMQVMGELAEIYGLDRETALAAGLLHDAAKDLTPDEQAQMVREAGITCRYPCEQDYNNYLHGPVGEYYIAKMLGVTDPGILGAIGTHTWVGGGERFNQPLAWCLRFADLLEPYRNWDAGARTLREGSPRLRDLAYSGRMEEAAMFEADLIIHFFPQIHVAVHPNHFQVYHEIKTRLGLSGPDRNPQGA